MKQSENITLKEVNKVQPFSERAQDMGLDMTHAAKGMYAYRDRFGEVVYRQFFTGRISGNPDEEVHPTDNLAIPYLGVYIKPPEGEDYEYAGHVSNAYKFVGNEQITGPLLDSIMTTGNPITKENIFFSANLAQMRQELVISSSVKSALAGDIMPCVIAGNSYNGTKAATVSFGIATMHNVDYVTFAFNLGTLRMVHIESSQTTMTSAVTDYIDVFRASISDMISESVQKRLNEEEMLAVLDLVEGLGKRRREIISENLPETVTAWGMFMAIVRYSSFEANLNIKSMLENIAESVLVIPTRMYDVLAKLQEAP